MCECESIIENIRMYYVPILAISKVQKPFTLRSFHSLGKRLHEYHDQAFNLSPLAMDVKKNEFLIFNTFSLYGYINFTLGRKQSYPGTIHFTILEEGFTNIRSMLAVFSCLLLLQKLRKIFSQIVSHICNCIPFGLFLICKMLLSIFK